MRFVLVAGTSKKKAKHSAAESLLSLVEGVDIESTAAEAQYVVNYLLQSVVAVIFCVYSALVPGPSNKLGD